jgi:alcohol dehydrogenase, propanol-preferring
MEAMILEKPGASLCCIQRDKPRIGPCQILIEVKACGVCRTDLHICDGELPGSKLPLVPGHEIVGNVIEIGAEVDHFVVGDRVGVPWLGQTCGTCKYCRRGQENLCNHARFTGYTLDGGYATHAVANEDYCFPISGAFTDVQAAPLLCAGLIGYRSLRMAGDANRLGIYGFGAAAHIVAQIAAHQGRQVFAFTRPGDLAAQELAKQYGAMWAGDSTASAPEELDAAIIFAPVGSLVPIALKSVAKGGTVVCGGIHMSDILAFPYDLLWGERIVRSLANLTRHDAQEFLALAPQIPLRTETTSYPLALANEAHADLWSGHLHGAAVLVP